jgi:two-component system, OmpR family, KDP operon response regulator KdpE
MAGKTILIINDDRHLLLGLTARLKASGYEVICAMDGTSGIASAQREAPDLVILDLGLPGDDGFQILKRMRALADLAATPVIVLSARAAADNSQYALEAGAVAFFQKPADNHQFLTAIRKTLGETVSLSTFLKA